MNSEPAMILALVNAVVTAILAYLVSAGTVTLTQSAAIASTVNMVVGFITRSIVTAPANLPSSNS